ncbi:RagB/SusD family nutrient uptake outer membrane protein [Flavihumibacter sp. RY-1]|uniref:RagB/SusD family nutrient uptake outer membrane protein n=1 Tax=Flavihumibacter fluminis TaxID=2909236 RepID=A0ABS9BDD4_9BACT|nr:RagB/SusD family nutrient uptake outer membrane protein [Flavihumibacter fluminis]MCF1713713.1 RagB/SusD family nutrient uptake outer membrane protein [Flavihumibacter fluminis]
MKRTTFSNIGYFLFLVTAMGIAGCKKVLNPIPYGQQTVDATFTDFNGAMNAVNGIYAQWSNGNLIRNSNSWLSIDQASDDVMSVSAPAGLYDFIDYFELVPDNATTFQIMDDFYRIIYRSNLVIERVPEINFPLAFQRNGTGSSFNDQFVGEALFMRAFAYYNLVRIFGGVPLHITAITGPDAVNLPRSSREAVYQQIEADLLEAAEKLPVSYNGSGAGNERGRVTRWTALVVLAEAYLTQKKYTEAKATAQQVLQNTGGFRLNNGYAASFPAINGGNENTPESLFEIQFSNAGIAANSTAPQGHNLSYIMGPLSEAVGGNVNLGRYRPTDNESPDNEPGFTGGLIQMYEEGDLRKVNNFHFVLGDGGVSRWLTRKYYEVGRASSSTGNVVLYRMADAYLIYAEATNELGGPDALSVELINQLRRRAFGLPLSEISDKDISPVQTQDSFREIIRSERRKELAMENKRWFDLCRYGFDFANQALNTNQKRTKFNQSKMLFPFPQIELINNPLLEQNPGY